MIHPKLLQNHSKRQTIPTQSHPALFLLIFCLIGLFTPLHAGHSPPPSGQKNKRSLAQEPQQEPIPPLTAEDRNRLLKKDHGPWTKKGFIDLRSAYPEIFVELRYASVSNFTGKQIYPDHLPCLVRVEVAHALHHADSLLKKQGYRLKVWDAWRPAQAQLKLWKAKPDPNYVTNPHHRRSQHGNGVAVDVTLVDLKGQPVPMPSDFDDFSRAAYFRYQGNDPQVAKNLVRLQKAMIQSGFRVYDLEWWHFTHRDLLKQSPAHLQPSDVGIQFPSP